MKMIERVRLIEEIGAADRRRGVAKWVRGWRRLRWLQRAVDTMPELLHVVLDPIRYEELDYHAVGVRAGIDVKEVEHRFSCALRYLHLVGRGEMSVADAGLYSYRSKLPALWCYRRLDQEEQRAIVWGDGGLGRIA